VLVGHQDEGVVRVLEANAVLERSDEVSEVERTCRPITRQ
jgi:hypothetical protein